MRLYPPRLGVWLVQLSVTELEGYRIPARAAIVMSQWIVHRDPRFFPEPEKFDPDRLNTRACQDLPRFAYFPFGGGPRQCIGASFATSEAVLILATVARRYQLTSVRSTPVPSVPSHTLRPKGPISMHIEAR